MAAWRPTFIIPNVYVREPVETAEAIFASCDDHRVRAIADEHERFKSFLSRFIDPFGKKVRPSLILLRADAPKSFQTIDAIASFRDAIALAVIPFQRAEALRYRRSAPAQYSDCFEFYPWMIDRNFRDLICNTPAMLGIHLVSEFRGQTAPVMSPISLDRRDMDTPLLARLLTRWRDRYCTTKPTWSDTALFRSLNMAMSASKMPAGPDMTLFGLGRSLVSAFEILIHPGGGDSGYRQVYSLLESVAWQQRQSRYKRYSAYMNRDPVKQRSAPKRILACWLYGEINKARNDFLHGNPVSARRLHIKRTKQSLFQYAAPLYRMALTGFLPLTMTPSASTDFDRDEFYFLATQRDFESALRTAFEPREAA